jgi:putative integral membrane protein (TIGR02587 family)
VVQLWRDELLALVRAASGGLLFGVPLLYTMEVWWTGTHTEPWELVAVLALLAGLVLVLNRTAGFRSRRDTHLVDAIADTVEAIAVGVLVTAAVLVLLREITLDTPVAVALGKVVYECVPFCLGVGVARHFLRGERSRPDDDGESTGLNATAADLGAAAIGATFIALSIAPTDEVPMIAAAMSPPAVLAVIAASLAASYAIVFAAGFTGQDERHGQDGAFQHPITETVVSYLIGLVVAFVLLWLFQREVQPSMDLLTRVIVLGLPAAVGGAAGRLAL